MNNSDLTWTEEVPTIDGWYWVRCEHGSWIEHIENSGVWDYHATLEEYTHEKLHKEQGYEFYGPLEEPK